MNYKTIIFDMDGTIINSGNIWDKAQRELIEKRGIVLTAEREHELNKLVFGLSPHKSCLVIKNMFELEHELDELIKDQVDIAASLFKEGVSFIDGFHTFIDKVVDCKLNKGIATNADDTTLGISRSQMGLDDIFGHHIYNPSCVGGSCKPDPELYLHAAQQLQTLPEHCIVIEDSRLGIQAAKKAGMFCIAINTGKNHEPLVAADLIVESYDDIDLEALLRTPKLRVG